jgi:WD40 repeat protein
LVATYSDGRVKHWHITTGQLLHEIDESIYEPNAFNVDSGTEEGNQTMTVDYFKNGTHFATAGSDLIVRVYDGNTRKRTALMFAG